MKYYKYILVIVSICISCNDSPTDIEIITGNGRIILEDGSIDGIKLGDEPSVVSQKFGKWDVFIQPMFDGFGWGYKSGIEFFFFRDYPKDTVYQIGAITLSEGYTGQTHNGIGIGTSREYLRNILKDDNNFNKGDSLSDGYNVEDDPEYAYRTSIRIIYDQSYNVNKINVVAYTKN